MKTRTARLSAQPLGNPQINLVASNNLSQSLTITARELHDSKQLFIQNRHSPDSVEQNTVLTIHVRANKSTKISHWNRKLQRFMVAAEDSRGLISGRWAGELRGKCEWRRVVRGIASSFRDEVLIFGGQDLNGEGGVG
eukprot:767579-Hanusia_phi.AAC.18